MAPTTSITTVNHFDMVASLPRCAPAIPIYHYPGAATAWEKDGLKRSSAVLASLQEIGCTTGMLELFGKSARASIIG
jgi:hypothetical protein